MEDFFDGSCRPSGDLHPSVLTSDTHLLTARGGWYCHISVLSLCPKLRTFPKAGWLFSADEQGSPQLSQGQLPSRFVDLHMSRMHACQEYF